MFLAFATCIAAVVPYPIKSHFEHVCFSKDIVVDFLHYTSPCTEDFVSFHTSAEARVQEIDANVEYNRFVEQRRYFAKSYVY